MQSRLTHFALHVADAEASAGFYEDIAGIQLLRSWANQDGSGLKVKWLKSPEASFVLVLLEGSSPFSQDRSQSVIGPLSHFGFDLPSREAVEQIARRGKAAGVLQMPPRDAGSIVGYHCYLRDPDGHSVEFRLWPGARIMGAIGASAPRTMFARKKRYNYNNLLF